MVSRRSDEKTKPLATALNNAAGSCFTVGVVAPTVAFLVDFGGVADKVTATALAVNAVVWFLGAALHLAARKMLDRLDE